jgi:hypothetical protein
MSWQRANAVIRLRQRSSKHPVDMISTYKSFDYQLSLLRSDRVGFDCCTIVIKIQAIDLSDLHVVSKCNYSLHWCIFVLDSARSVDLFVQCNSLDIKTYMLHTDILLHRRNKCLAIRLCNECFRPRPLTCTVFDQHQVRLCTFRPI